MIRAQWAFKALNVSNDYIYQQQHKQDQEAAIQGKCSGLKRTYAQIVSQYGQDYVNHQQYR